MYSIPMIQDASAPLWDKQPMVSKDKGKDKSEDHPSFKSELESQPSSSIKKSSKNNEEKSFKSVTANSSEPDDSEINLNNNDNFDETIVMPTFMVSPLAPNEQPLEVSVEKLLGDQVQTDLPIVQEAKPQGSIYEEILQSNQKSLSELNEQQVDTETVNNLQGVDSYEVSYLTQNQFDKGTVEIKANLKPVEIKNISGDVQQNFVASNQEMEAWEVNQENDNLDSQSFLDDSSDNQASGLQSTSSTQDSTPVHQLAKGDFQKMVDPSLSNLENTHEIGELIDHSMVAHQVTQGISKGIKNNETNLSISLTPEELGRVQIELKIKDGYAQASIHVESQKALEALLEQKDMLQEIFAQNQIQTDSSSLNFSFEASSDNQYFNDSNRQAVLSSLHSSNVKAEEVNPILRKMVSSSSNVDIIA